jgi:hypothetical protein
LRYRIALKTRLLPVNPFTQLHMDSDPKVSGPLHIFFDSLRKK